MSNPTRRRTGARWPRWTRLDDPGVGLTFKGGWWRLLDLGPIGDEGAPVVFGNKFVQRDFAEERAEQEWAEEQVRRAEAVLPLGSRPGFVALHKGEVVAAGRTQIQASRLAVNELRRRAGRPVRPSLNIVPATADALAVWASEGAIEIKLLSPGYREYVALTVEQANTYAAAFATMAGWCLHDYLYIEGFGRTQNEASIAADAAIAAKYPDATSDHLEFCEVTVACMALLEAGMNLPRPRVVDRPGEYCEPIFRDERPHLWHIPGAPVISKVACSTAEASALHEVGKLVPEYDSERVSIMVRC